MGVIKHSRTVSTNDSNVTVLTAAARTLIEIIQLHITYTSSATVGNRALRLAIYDETDTTVADYHVGVDQAASLTRHYVCARGVYRESAFVDGEIQFPIPFGTVLLPGWYLIVKDNAAIDATADDMTINIIYEETSRNDGGAIT